MSTRFFHDGVVLVAILAALLGLNGVVFAEDHSPPVAGANAGNETASAKKQRERDWRLRFFGAIAGGSAGIVMASGVPHPSVSITGGGGVGINFEHRTSQRMGFEIGAMAVGGNLRVGAGNKYHHNVGSVQADGYVPITFALNYHPFESSQIVDFFVGPLAASTYSSIAAVGPGVRVESRVDFGLGANLGVDINFSRRSRWSFSSGLKYIWNITNSGDDGNRFDFDPVIFSLGFGYRF